MDKSLITVLMLTPGITGIAVTCLLCGTYNPGSLSQNITKYFLYSAFAWLLAEFIGPGYALSAVLQGRQITVMQLLTPIALAAFLAAAWVLFAKDALIGMINKIYEKTGRNKTFLKESLFEAVFDKNCPQAIEVTKNGVTIVKGSLEYYHDGDKAFSLKDLSEYSECEEKTLRYLFYPDKELVIREFTYPELMGEDEKN